VTLADGPSVLPVPDGGGGHTNLNGDILLAPSQFEATPAQVLADSGWLAGELLN